MLSEPPSTSRYPGIDRNGEKHVDKPEVYAQLGRYGSLDWTPLDGTDPYSDPGWCSGGDSNP